MFACIKFFMVTHNAIPSGTGGFPVRMINASIMESMDYGFSYIHSLEFTG
jgi:hypothetical protein